MNPTNFHADSEHLQQERTPVRQIRLFYSRSVALIFLFTGFAKLLSTYTVEERLSYDPFIWIVKVHHLAYIAGVLEVLVAVVILALHIHRQFLAIDLALWMGAVFSFYRIGFALSPSGPGRCKCFGAIGGIFSSHSDGIAFAMLVYIITGGLIVRFLKTHASNRE